MAKILRRNDLVERGIEALEEAKDCLDYSEVGARRAAVQAEIGAAYARLAEALGDDSVYRY